MLKNEKLKGQLIVEVIVALGVLTIGFMGTLALLSRSIGLSRVVSDNYTATYLAAEGIEIVRNIISRDNVNIARDPLATPWASGFIDGVYEVEYGSDLLTAIPPQSGPRPILFNSLTKFYSYLETSDTRETPFVRAVGIELKHNNNEMAVSSTVRWSTRGGGNFEIVLEDHFFNWVPPVPPPSP